MVFRAACGGFARAYFGGDSTERMAALLPQWRFSAPTVANPSHPRKNVALRRVDDAAMPARHIISGIPG